MTNEEIRKALEDNLSVYELKKLADLRGVSGKTETEIRHRLKKVMERQESYDRLRK